MKKIDMKRLRREIHLYAGLLGMHGAKADPAEVEQLRTLGKAFPWGYPVKRHQFFMTQHRLVEAKVPAYVRFTQLVVLRAHLRGRLHFSPNTNLSQAQWIFGVPAAVKSVPGGYEYRPITMEIQGQWVEPLMAEFEAIKEVTPQEAVG